MYKGLVVDGYVYDVIVNVTRVATVTPSEISGMMMDKTYYNDVIATYFQYDVQVVVPIGSERDYFNLYDVLVDPVSEHLFQFPFNDYVTNIYGRVESVSDTFYKYDPVNDTNIWRNISFSVIANRPSLDNG